MNNRDFAKAVVTASGLPIQEVKLMMYAMHHVIVSKLEQGESVNMGDFGSFHVENELSHEHEQDGNKQINLSTIKAVVFNAGKGLAIPDLELMK